jgi:hypothetical protein
LLFVSNLLLFRQNLWFRLTKKKHHKHTQKRIMLTFWIHNRWIWFCCCDWL